MTATNYIYNDNLETNRLITRFLTANDVSSWTDFFRDKEAVEFLPMLGISSYEEKAKYWIEMQLNRYSENRFGLQAIIDKRTNMFIGQCGLLTQKVDGRIEIEVGYHILKKYWGQGFAPETAKLFIEYAFKNNISSSIISIIDKRNIKSQRVADKNGLICEKETKWLDREVYIYRINTKD